MKAYTWPEGVTEVTQDNISAILWTIYHYGPFEDESGRATGLLQEALKKEGYDLQGPYLSTLVKQCEGDGKFGRLIKRDVNGKRTYSIKLAVDPAKRSFPPDPFADASEENDVLEDESEIVDEGMIEDLEEIDTERVAALEAQFDEVTSMLGLDEEVTDAAGEVHDIVDEVVHQPNTLSQRIMATIGELSSIVVELGMSSSGDAQKIAALEADLERERQAKEQAVAANEQLRQVLASVGVKA